MQETMTLPALIKASAIAVVIAAVTLLTLILPAEYDIDPTGIGGKLGLTQLAQVDGEEAVAVTTSDNDSQVTDESNLKVDILIAAGKGIEYKFAMAQFAKMEYEWHTDGGRIYFDLHGEPEGDTTGYFESYSIATTNEMRGSYTTPFAGSHGWYFKNRSNEDITVSLSVKGQYELIGLKQ